MDDKIYINYMLEREQVEELFHNLELYDGLAEVIADEKVQKKFESLYKEVVDFYWATLREEGQKKELKAKFLDKEAFNNIINDVWKELLIAAASVDVIYQRINFEDALKVNSEFYSKINVKELIAHTKQRIKFEIENERIKRMLDIEELMYL